MPHDRRICRDFRCYRMVILDPDGHECGRIMGRNDLKTTDETLEADLERTDRHHYLPSHDDPRWEKAVIDALAYSGYFGECVE